MTESSSAWSKEILDSLEVILDAAEEGGKARTGPLGLLRQAVRESRGLSDKFVHWHLRLLLWSVCPRRQLTKSAEEAIGHIGGILGLKRGSPPQKMLDDLVQKVYPVPEPMTKGELQQFDPDAFESLMSSEGDGLDLFYHPQSDDVQSSELRGRLDLEDIYVAGTAKYGPEDLIYDSGREFWGSVLHDDEDDEDDDGEF